MRPKKLTPEEKDEENIRIEVLMHLCCLCYEYSDHILDSDFCLCDKCFAKKAQEIKNKLITKNDICIKCSKKNVDYIPSSLLCEICRLNYFFKTLDCQRESIEYWHKHKKEIFEGIDINQRRLKKDQRRLEKIMNYINRENGDKKDVA